MVWFTPWGCLRWPLAAVGWGLEGDTFMALAINVMYMSLKHSITVDDSVYKVLWVIKHKYGYDSYNRVIKDLILGKIKIY